MVQRTARTPQVGQELHSDVPLDVGEGGVELVQLEDHPSRGEVHVEEQRRGPFTATATTKVCAQMRRIRIQRFLRGEDRRFFSL